MLEATDASLDLIFREARTHSAWLDKPVDDALLRRAYDLAKLGPTSANMCPMRIVFVKSKEAKEKLKPALDAGNVDKTMAAPVTAIIAMDIRFYEHLPKLFPHADAKAWFKDLPENVLEYIVPAQFVAARRLFHAGGAIAWPRLRADVRFQQRQGGCRVLCRDDRQIEFPLQPRPRRHGQAPSAQPAFEF